MTEVSQSARKAAAKLHTTSGRDEVAALTAAGALDMLPTVQAFARFEAEIRAEATTGADALVGEALAATKRFVDALREAQDEGGHLLWSQVDKAAHECDAALSAIDGGRGGRDG